MSQVINSGVAIKIERQEDRNVRTESGANSNSETVKEQQTNQTFTPGTGAPKVDKDAQQHANLKAMLLSEKKFSSRARLFIGNVPGQATEETIMKLFENYGDTKEFYLNKDKGWAFIKLDYKINAEMAKNAVDGHNLYGRNLRVKFATHTCAVEVHGLSTATSNEVLHKGFSMFGEVEKATVVCDMRGTSKGYGIVEYGWKKPAQIAAAKTTDGFLVLGRLPKPVTVKPYDHEDKQDGVRDKDLMRSYGARKEREYLPRMVTPDSWEYPLCEKWRSYEAMAKEKREQVEKELTSLRESLEKEMEEAVTKMEYDIQQNSWKQQQGHAAQEEARMREMHHNMMLNRQREMEIRGQENPATREELRQQEFRRQEEFIRQQQMELEIRKRMAAQEARRDFPLPVDMPRPPRMFTPENAMFRPRLPNNQMNGPRLPFPHGAPPRRDNPAQLEGFFENKRPRMY